MKTRRISATMHFECCKAQPKGGSTVPRGSRNTFGRLAQGHRFAYYGAHDEQYVEEYPAVEVK
jgi:hypothetical protein